ncbi:MAG: nitronate monooxygenase [Hyphomicrobiales bacterium]|nr:nitronate monooxygenase [Hyphomicrobiales bacterium]
MFGARIPIVQAPMAGVQGAALCAAVCQAGGVGSLPAAMMTLDQLAGEITAVRAQTDAPFNVNFFAHRTPQEDADRTARWLARLRPYYEEAGLDPAALPKGPGRAPFDEAACRLVEELKPPIVSFHFGLPDEAMLARVRASGARIWGCATTVAEARWLDAHGVDAIIAQGAEAGGHRGMFLSDDIDAQPGLFALTPQVVDATRVPVIAAGGVADGRGVAAALALGAKAVQIGTAYLLSPQATTSPLHRAALKAARDDATRMTNLYTGRPARGALTRFMQEVGPMNADAPAFPLATGFSAPLRAAAEARGSSDFSPLWSGQAAALASETDAGILTQRLWRDAQIVMRALSEAGAPA